jgi:hypothetical protein
MKHSTGSTSRWTNSYLYSDLGLVFKILLVKYARNVNICINVMFLKYLTRRKCCSIDGFILPVTTTVINLTNNFLSINSLTVSFPVFSITTWFRPSSTVQRIYSVYFGALANRATTINNQQSTIIGTTAHFEPRPSSEASAIRPYFLRYSSNVFPPTSWHHPLLHLPILV